MCTGEHTFADGQTMTFSSKAEFKFFTLLKLAGIKLDRSNAPQLSDFYFSSFNGGHSYTADFQIKSDDAFVTGRALSDLFEIKYRKHLKADYCRSEKGDFFIINVRFNGSDEFYCKRYSYEIKNGEIDITGEDSLYVCVGIQIFLDYIGRIITDCTGIYKPLRPASLFIDEYIRIKKQIKWDEQQTLPINPKTNKTKIITVSSIKEFNDRLLENPDSMFSITTNSSSLNNLKTNWLYYCFKGRGRGKDFAGCLNSVLSVSGEMRKYSRMPSDYIGKISDDDFAKYCDYKKKNKAINKLKDMSHVAEIVGSAFTTEPEESLAPAAEPEPEPWHPSLLMAIIIAILAHFGYAVTRAVDTPSPHR